MSGPSSRSSIQSIPVLTSPKAQSQRREVSNPIERLASKSQNGQGVGLIAKKGGCNVGALLLATPEKFVGRRISLLNPGGTQYQDAVVSHHDGKKYYVQIDNSIHCADLWERVWCLTGPTPNPLPQQENDNNNNGLSHDQMDYDDGSKGKGRRKRTLRGSKQEMVLPAKRVPTRASTGQGRRGGGHQRTGEVGEQAQLPQGQELMGKRVQIQQNRSGPFFAARVMAFDPIQHLHRVSFADESEAWVDMETATWRLSPAKHDPIYQDSFECSPDGQACPPPPASVELPPQSTTTTATETLENPSSRKRRLSSPSSSHALAVQGLLSMTQGGVGGSRQGHIQHTAATLSHPEHSAQQLEGSRGKPGDRQEGQKVPEDGGNQPTSSGPPEIGGRKLVASSMEFQVHKVDNPMPGYHVLCSVPPGTRISDVHVTCGNACIIIEHGNQNKEEVSRQLQAPPMAASNCSRLVVLLPEPIKPSSASAKLTQGGKLAVFTALA